MGDRWTTWWERAGRLGRREIKDGWLAGWERAGLLGGNEGGRVLDWDVVALLDGRLLDERTLVKLDGRMSAGLECGGVAGRETAG